MGHRAGMHAEERTKSLPLPGIEPGPSVCSSKPSVVNRPCETCPAPAHAVILKFRMYINNAEEKVKSYISSSTLPCGHREGAEV